MLIQGLRSSYSLPPDCHIISKTYLYSKVHHFPSLVLCGSSGGTLVPHLG